MLQLIRENSDNHSARTGTSKTILPGSEMGGHEDAKSRETEPERTAAFCHSERSESRNLVRARPLHRRRSDTACHLPHLRTLSCPFRAFVTQCRY